MENEDERAKKNILEYWTLVEFFSPYSLERVLDNRRSYQRVFGEEKQRLPWENRPPLDRDDPTSSYEKGYNLYLAIFSMEETADRARHVFCQQPNLWQSIDWRHCGNPSSSSCFAKLTLSRYGTPLWSTLSLSTLPWAHGELLNNGTATLSIEEYWKSVHNLLVTLREEFSRELPMQLVREPKQYGAMVDHHAIAELAHILFRWAGYHPKNYPLALIEPLLPSSTPKNEVMTAAKMSPLNSNVGEETAKELLPLHDLEPTATENNIPILNSFYVAELERARASLESCKETPLHRYLGGSAKMRVDIESEEGKKKLLNALTPSHFPKGRWPSPPYQRLSLMQQFTVNQATTTLAEGGLFSVNGPPGTGKTTLLRELFAHNIVARAEALAAFTHPKEAFTEPAAVGFGDGDAIFISKLHPSLLGYEMLLVSSNNVAVQNLSNELPLKKQLAPSFAEASYLQSVSERLHGDKGDESWGILSAAIGNMENCKRVVEKIFISREEGEKGERIWEWVESYEGPTFKEAKEKFTALKQIVEDLQGKIESLAEYHEELTSKETKQKFNDTLLALESAQKRASTEEKKVLSLKEEEREAKGLHELLEKRVKLWEKERPPLVSSLVKGKRWNEWNEQSSIYTREEIAALEELHRCKKAVNEAALAHKKCEEELHHLEIAALDEALWHEWCKEEHRRLHSLYRDVSLPSGVIEFDDPDLQKKSFYQNDTLNELQSELFLAALALHEAWLAETLRRKGGFRGNLMAISHILQGKQPTTSDDTRFVWQSLFLLIPLLSSTFASIGRLFRCLEPGSIGWLFIDEAGQALPQAAVGAIWRAKRVLSIGDPFQIEPISTIAPEIVDGIAKTRIGDHCLHWAPSRISVQHLTDNAAEYGTTRHIHDTPFWLGSPLKVHRRCQEPMFSIANEIAYEKSMVLSLPQKMPCPLPESCWYDICGTTSSRQFVPSQGDFLLLKLQEALYKMECADLYVISPFREVVDQIAPLAVKNRALQQLFATKFPNDSLMRWAKESIGTVHAFQGKQASVLFFVLGADAANLGAIDWASRKPNLLNVAVTRACDRLYLIGDYDLWRKWPFFDVAARHLARVRHNS